MREPDLAGVARAWRISEDPRVQERHIREFGHEHTGLQTWLINGPYHPFWSWWHVGVISLRDFEGMPPAQKQYPAAEFEFAIYSLDGTPDIEAIERGDLDNRGFKFLSPPDVVFHFDGVNDRQAVEICDAAVQLIVRGQSCDSDFRRFWDGSLRATVEHYKKGGHP